MLGALGLGRRRSARDTVPASLDALITPTPTVAATPANPAAEMVPVEPRLLAGLKPIRDRYLGSVLSKLTQPVLQVGHASTD